MTKLIIDHLNVNDLNTIGETKINGRNVTRIMKYYTLGSFDSFRSGKKNI